MVHLSQLFFNHIYFKPDMPCDDINYIVIICSALKSLYIYTFVETLKALHCSSNTAFTTLVGKVVFFKFNCVFCYLGKVYLFYFKSSQFFFQQNTYIHERNFGGKQNCAKILRNIEYRAHVCARACIVSVIQFVITQLLFNQSNKTSAKH